MDLLRKAFESKLQSAGLNWIKLQAFELRPKTKSIALEILLEGEPAPVTVSANYELVKNELKFTALTTSKIWITEALNLVLLKNGGSMPLPSGLKGSLIKFFL